MNCLRIGPGVLICTFVAALTARVSATLVAPMNVQQVADLSAQVMDATVISVQSYWAENPKRIESEVTLAPIEYLKGSPSATATTQTLVVPGGQVGTMQMRIAGAPEFKPGERWILCLLPTYKTFPVVGITHGAFRVEQDSASQWRVLNAGGEPITGIDANGFLEVAATRAITKLSDQVGTEASVEAGLTRDEFVELIQPILQTSKVIELTQPAGTRELVQYTPVPFRQQIGSTAAVNSVPGTRPVVKPEALMRRRIDTAKTTRKETPR